MGKAPPRDRHVYFAGAGLSCAFGLPNTAALLTKIAEDPSIGSALLHSHLGEAYKALYPDGDRRLFTPDTVDFFSSLQAFIDIGAPGLPGVNLKEARELHRDLKFAITRLLVTVAKAAEASGKLASNAYLDAVIQPGNVVITSNWDLLLERTAEVRGVPVRRSGKPSASDMLLLKLHGSIDWLEWGQRRPRSAEALDDFATIRETKRRIALPADGADELVRIRIGNSQWGQCWQRIKARTEEPFIVTMYRGKGAELSALAEVWTDAYSALSHAKSIEIVGYSLPPDDLEIRTLLRAGLTRGQQKVAVTVRNPAPDVHARIRQHVFPQARSDYSSV